MIRTPNEISVALTRSEMNEVHALNQIEYQEMLADIPNDKEGATRKRKIELANKNRLELHRQMLTDTELTEEEKQDQRRRRKKQAAENLTKPNPYANNQ